MSDPREEPVFRAQRLLDEFLAISALKNAPPRLAELREIIVSAMAQGLGMESSDG